MRSRQRSLISTMTSIEADGVLYTETNGIAQALNTHFSRFGTKLAAKIKDKLRLITKNSKRFSYVPLGDIPTRIFYRSLEASTFPSIWKCGKVTALSKGGDRSECNNYKPITVLPTISKILERAVHQQMYEFLSANTLLTPNQFGFRPKLSTVTALAHFIDNILQSLDRGGFTGAVFLDLSKAFDTVDHVLLVEKFKTIGARSQVVKWFASYLESGYQVKSV